jgi:hypothetical protein
MILVSWNGNNINDGTNYQAILDASTYGLPGIDPKLGLRQGAWPLLAGIERPGKIVNFEIYIRGASVGTKQKQLSQWFDPDDETPKQLIGQDAGGGNTRYLMGVCIELAEVPFSAGLRFVVSIQVHGDVMWRETTPTNPSDWLITATGQTKVVANGGEMDCYPILTITPTSAKTGSWSFKRFMVVRWRADGVGADYPTDIANNALDTRIASTNFALASGDDLRVWVDGIEVDRWLDGEDTATTKVWANLDFAAAVNMTLDGAIGAGDTELTVNESINKMPSSGILYIDSEAITYASKSNNAKTFYGLTRGAKGTTAASHTDTTTVFWLQHDIWILYGNAAAGSPPANAATKPMFRLDTSTNTSWDYDDFNSFDPYFPIREPRSGSWSFAETGAGEVYTGNQGAFADPQIELGCHSVNYDFAKWYLDNPCGITNANFVNGQKRTDNYLQWGALEAAYIYSDLAIEYYVPAPTINNTWQTWSQNEALTTGAKTVGLFAETDYYMETYIEAADVTLTLNSSNTPTIVIGAEQSSYSLDCVITNQTTGDSIELTFNMETNEDLEFDTDAKTVIYLLDNTNQFQALTVSGGPRRDWLPLQPGNNTLRFDDVGTNGVTIDVTYEERFYQ